MIDVKIARVGESLAIVITVPRAGSSAGSPDVAAIATQNFVAYVAAAAGGLPAGEEVAVVRRAVALGLDGQLGEVGARGGGGDGSGKVAAAGEGAVDRGCDRGAGGQEDGEGGGEDHCVLSEKSEWLSLIHI